MDKWLYKSSFPVALSRKMLKKTTIAFRFGCVPRPISVTRATAYCIHPDKPHSGTSGQTAGVSWGRYNCFQPLSVGKEFLRGTKKDEEVCPIYPKTYRSPPSKFIFSLYNCKITVYQEFPKDEKKIPIASLRHKCRSGLSVGCLITVQWKIICFKNLALRLKRIFRKLY